MNSTEQSHDQNPPDVTSDYLRGRFNFLHAVIAHILIRLAKVDGVHRNSMLDFLDLEAIAHRSFTHPSTKALTPQEYSKGLEDGLASLKHFLETDSFDIQ